VEGWVPQDPFRGLTPDELKKLLLKLAGHAAFRARNYWWRSANHQDLCKGMHLDDVVQEAMTKVMEDTRQFDESRGPLLPYLKRVVDSIISNLADSYDNRVQDRFPEQGRSEAEEIDRSRARYRGVDPNAWFGKDDSPDPEGYVLGKELSAPQVVALAAALDDDAELKRIFNAIAIVGGKAADISTHTDIPIEWPAPRKLRRNEVESVA
jgi:DNA-directed RNA polymerase specialized sigma24 family protein